MNISKYWGIRKAERCSALPVPEYTCVRYTCGQINEEQLEERWPLTCVVAVGRHEKKLQANTSALGMSIDADLNLTCMQIAILYHLYQ